MKLTEHASPCVRNLSQSMMDFCIKTTLLLALPFFPSPSWCPQVPGIWLAGDRRGRKQQVGRGRWKVAQQRVGFALSAVGCACQLPPGTEFCLLGWISMCFGEDVPVKSQPCSVSGQSRCFLC